MNQVFIAADDLTGANANGALLAAKGFTAFTCLGLGLWNAEHCAAYDAVSVNAESRLLPPDEAAKRIFDAVRLPAQSGFRPQVVAKRIDSTLRGNVGSETQAALAALDSWEDEFNEERKPAMAVVVPSFPASGRFTVGGYLIVNGVPLEKTPMAVDPTTPVTSSRCIDVIRTQSSLPTAHVPLQTVLKGVDAVKTALLELYAQGVRAAVCDAVTDEDISVVAGALRDAPFPVLAVDPGPFTAALAHVRAHTRQEHEGHVLLIVGSATELTRRQLEALRPARPCSIAKVDCPALVNPATREKAMTEAVNAVCAGAATAQVFGVCTVEHSEDVFSLEAVAKENGISVKEVSERISGGLAEIAERLLSHDELRIGGLYTSGGEVTVAVVRRLKASGFSVRDEVLPLAVYGRLAGGARSNIPMVTKGGFVGDDGSIVQCINYLFTKISTRTRPSAEDD